MDIELCQVFYCQPSPSKHHTPKPVIFFWRLNKCQPVVAMFTPKKFYKPLACRHPRSNLGVNPHISGPSVLSFRERADMDYIGVVTDACTGGKNGSHETEHIELLNQNLLCIGQDEADCQTGLELSCGECN